MSLMTPPSMDDSLFPDLLDTGKSKPSIVLPKNRNKVVTLRVNTDIDDDLVSYLSNDSPTRPGVQPPSPCSSTETVDTCTKSWMSRDKCMTKSAIAARENRMKKKKHIETLEDEVSTLGKENKELKCSVTSLTSEVSALRTEVLYLKSVLANQSTLSSLLKNIPGTPGVRLNSSMTDHLDSDADNDDNISVCDYVSDSEQQIGSKRKADNNDHPYASLASQKRLKTDKDAGICLHVSGKDVSLEFCSSCNRKSQHTRK